MRAAPLVTKTLLFVTEGDQVNARTPPGGGGRKLRAFDKATGKVVWETELPAGATGAPMTYQVKGHSTSWWPSAASVTRPSSSRSP